mgnify:FL=1
MCLKVLSEPSEQDRHADLHFAIVQFICQLKKPKTQEQELIQGSFDTLSVKRMNVKKFPHKS